jgi:ATP phosphoribosyltransferase
MLTVAVPKGRVLKPLAALLERAGVPTKVLLEDDRTLVRTAGDVRFLLLKPDDVPTYVEHGAADIGVCGRDVLDERQPDVLRPLDLGIGRCRLVVAAKAGTIAPAIPRVATKYPRTTEAHFAHRGVQAEIVYVQGSVELAPLVGLADLIVDLVETGSTLAQNGLEVRGEISSVSSLLIANRAAFKLQRASISTLVDRLRAVIT